MQGVLSPGPGRFQSGAACEHSGRYFSAAVAGLWPLARSAL